MDSYLPVPTDTKSADIMCSRIVHSFKTAGIGIDHGKSADKRIRD
jgi:hypothetical protein